MRGRNENCVVPRRTTLQVRTRTKQASQPTKRVTVSRLLQFVLLCAPFSGVPDATSNFTLYPSTVAWQVGDGGFTETGFVSSPGEHHLDVFLGYRAGRPHSVATRGVGTPPDVMRRGLLPFPLSATSADIGGHSSGCHTRTQKRRLRRSTEARGLLSDLCGSLNELGGFGRDGGSDAVNEVQSTALDRLQHDCKETAEITRGVVPLESFRDLMSSRGGYGSSEGISCGNSVMYQKGALKLPVGGAGRHDLIDFLPEPWSTSMRHGTGILLDAGSVPSTPLTDIGCAVDPVLRRGIRLWTLHWVLE